MTVVVKEQLCGKDCEGCPHGPYAYRVTTNSDGSQSWEYLGKAGAVDEVDTEDVGENLTNTSDGDDSMDLEGTGDLYDDVKHDDGDPIGVFEIETRPGNTTEWEFQIEGDDVVISNEDYGEELEIDKEGLQNAAETFRSLSDLDKNVAPYDERGEVVGLRTDIDGDEVIFGLNPEEDSNSRPYIGGQKSTDYVKAIERKQNSKLLGSAETTSTIEADDYVAKIEGSDPQYGYDREFLGDYDSGPEYDIRENGVYEISDNGDKRKIVYYEGITTEIDEDTLSMIKKPDKTLHDVIDESLDSKDVVAQKI